MSQPVPFWEHSLRYRRLGAEARAAARKAQDDYSWRSLMLLADGLENLAEAFSPTALYWNPAPANDNVVPGERTKRAREGDPAQRASAPNKATARPPGGPFVATQSRHFSGRS